MVFPLRHSCSAAKTAVEYTMSLCLVRLDVLSLIKAWNVLFSHQKTFRGGNGSVLMDSGNVMRASRVDTKRPWERQRTPLLTYTLMAVTPGQSMPFWGEPLESFKIQLCSFTSSNAVEGAPKSHVAFSQIPNKSLQQYMTR